MFNQLPNPSFSRSFCSLQHLQAIRMAMMSNKMMTPFNKTSNKFLLTTHFVRAQRHIAQLTE